MKMYLENVEKFIFKLLTLDDHRLTIAIYFSKIFGLKCCYTFLKLVKINKYFFIYLVFSEKN